ncbi:uncharacterized protein F4822DRAFT_45716 [Hypoxylon trugodes]|uniref:uncharacterized protein n=1 Tax=Hypoxylon trugodes TaxID=326681 RepID=UPI00219541AB|nr:uncharacterized protein F4822DRAFT_45716 [Hypoxylon trugodes]KAI1394356.1 hypothetical protein F4822DRAFT_45716 [Hypoxylon trugodes]
MLGFGIAFVFFRPLVFFVVLDEVLQGHYILLPVDLTLLWMVTSLPIALIVDGPLWLLNVLTFLGENSSSSEQLMESCI